ncbi:MAG: hypothetical protein UZ17_ACD001001725 [Acidobacteria bacterium OLB17]|nr:MAG: hypothetical protein UZ17_ACD001001725 [Acidobacteria bacterium OLB17]
MERDTTRQKNALAAFAKHVLRKVFVEDWHLKLLALAITFALWFAVTGLSKPTTARFSNVRLSMQSSDNTITDSEVSTIDLVLSGDARKINQIDSLSASVDLRGLRRANERSRLRLRTFSCRCRRASRSTTSGRIACR